MKKPFACGLTATNRPELHIPDSPLNQVSFSFFLSWQAFPEPYSQAAAKLVNGREIQSGFLLF